MSNPTKRAVLGAQDVRDWLGLAAASIREQRDYLTQLDAAIGDADHGSNMDRGFGAVRELLTTAADDMTAGGLLTAAGDTLISTVGGASGALWGTALQRAGRSLGDVTEVDGIELGDALQAALDGIVELGAARVGEKTMVDVLDPAVRALRDGVAAGSDLPESVHAALEAGEEGMRATIPMLAAKGRASYLGERSVGHQDPGATSTVMILAALDQVVAPRR